MRIFSFSFFPFVRLCISSGRATWCLGENERTRVKVENVMNKRDKEEMKQKSSDANEEKWEQ